MDKKNNTHIYAAYKTLHSDLKTQYENEGMEKGFPCKWK